MDQRFSNSLSKSSMQPLILVMMIFSRFLKRALQEEMHAIDSITLPGVHAYNESNDSPLGPIETSRNQNLVIYHSKLVVHVSRASMQDALSLA